jgi:hypothetical protein
VLLFSGQEGALLRTIHGASPESKFGFDVGLAGNIDGDALPDLLVGAEEASGDPVHAGVVIVLAGRSSPARYANYGIGWPGGDGVPGLTLKTAPSLCSVAELLVGPAYHLSTGVLILGPAPASIPTSLDGTLLVAPAASVTFHIGPPTWSLPLPIPCSYQFAGAAIYLQAIVADPRASQGAAFTPGLRMVLGS